MIQLRKTLSHLGLAWLVVVLGTSGLPATTAQTEVVAALTCQLQSPDLPARTEAVLGLLELGPGAKEAFPSLVTILADDEALDSVIAAQALYAKVRLATDVASLTAALKHDTKARVPAAWELSRIGLPAGSAAASALIGALHNPDKHERNFIVVALATTATPTRDVVRALLEVLKDEGSAESQQTNYKYPRASAAIALGMMGPDAGEAVPTLVQILGEKGTWDVQRAANCFALGRIGSAASNALPALQVALQDTSPVVRAHAGRAIQAIAPLSEKAAGSSAILQPGDVPSLLRALNDSPRRINPKVVSGLRALGEFAGATKPVTKKRSRKTAPPVHESIALAISYLDSLPQLPSPEEIARQEKTGGLDVETVRYLMALGGVQQGIAPTLLEALMQGEHDQRVVAIHRLAALGQAAQDAIPVLTELLRDDDPLVRRAAFRALHQIKRN